MNTQHVISQPPKIHYADTSQDTSGHTLDSDIESSKQEDATVEDVASSIVPCSNLNKPYNSTNTVVTNTTFNNVLHKPHDFLKQSTTFSLLMTCDIHSHSKYVRLYSKGLPHNSESYVDLDCMRELIHAITSQNLSKLPSYGQLLGICNVLNVGINVYSYKPLPDIFSDRLAPDMIELYCMALSRDIPFSQYNTHKTILNCCSYLNAIKGYCYYSSRVNSDLIFRGTMYADLHGLYISQLLYLNIKDHKQKYNVCVNPSDYMKTWDTTLASQNGIFEVQDTDTQVSRYISTGRDLASMVHDGDILQIMYNACTILYELGVPTFSNKLDIQCVMAIIARTSFIFCDYVKWNTLYLRPEALGIEIERVFKGRKNIYAISPELLKNPVLPAIRNLNKNVLLSQVYREGAPMSPAMPSEHIVIASACATILKFFFDTGYELDIYEPDNDGSTLKHTDKKTCVEDEINKLASNIGFGYCWAGIQYHMNVTHDMQLGERIAISYLKDIVYTYPVPINTTFNKFSGRSVVISNHD